jgi:hypothetical protein
MSSAEKISGLYKGTFKSKTGKQMQLELRVDIDGGRSAHIVSGDLLDEQSQYLGSFRFQTLKTQTSKHSVVIIGKTGQFSTNICNFSDITVTVPLESNQRQAEVQWVDNHYVLTKFTCSFKSEFFRTIQLEHDYEEEVAPFKPYDTNDLPSPLPKRKKPISITDAYAEAGIKIIEKQKTNKIPHPKRTVINGIAWTDKYLKTALTENFTLLNDKTPWKVWLFSANEYVIGDTNGITITLNEKQQLGCAVFQHATGWQTAYQRRMRLFICIHEIGHCFNLPHPWNWPRSGTDENQNGHQTLSWMNYPWAYHSAEQPYGETAFWNAFNFQFSLKELAHLRHGFSNDTICDSNIP